MKEVFMLKNINIVRLAIYCLLAIAILVNAALLFADFYTPENSALALSLFVLGVALLIIVPTYWVARTSWLRK